VRAREPSRPKCRAQSSRTLPHRGSRGPTAGHRLQLTQFRPDSVAEHREVRDKECKSARPVELFQQSAAREEGSGIDALISGTAHRRAPPADGGPFSAALKVRQTEVQVIPGPSGSLAAAWTDDTNLEGFDGLGCSYSVSLDGEKWSPTLYHKSQTYEVTGNPTIGMDSRGVIYAVAMCVDKDYSKGALELSTSRDGGNTWSPWTTILTRDKGIPDRPKLLAEGEGQLHLVYSDVELVEGSLKHSRVAVKLVQSKDGGQTWSRPSSLSAKPRRSLWFIDGYQGASIQKAATGEIITAWGDYYGSRLRFSKSSDGGATFTDPMAISVRRRPFAFGTPATELTADPGGENLVISVHEAHAMRPIVILGSPDRGKTWGRLRELSDHGTNASVTFDASGRLHAMWTELHGGRMDTLYAVSPDHGRTFSAPVSLVGGGYPLHVPRDQTGRDRFEEACGSYQSLVVDAKGRAHAFWLDWRAGFPKPKVYSSSWKST
jgi:BNR repeat-like domain